MRTEESSLRLFVALWPDPATRAALSALQQQVRGRLVHRADLHLTLVFLGLQPASALPAVKEALAHLPCGTLPLTLDRAGHFTRNRIAWAGTHDVPAALLVLHESLKAALTERGVQWKEDTRPFTPHITLARDAAPLQDMVFTPIPWIAREVALVASDTDATGARYRVLINRNLDEAVRIPDAGENGPLALHQTLR